ncbi:MAG: single-stranded-DNA-specific exonuclease RecJ [Anaerolineales bacterium]|nr:single-stranded-DNA-specific exonuclease RecJ [Anaerolineales bacterium]
MMKPNWQIAPPAPANHLARFPQLSPLIVQLLYNRGITAPLDVRDFLAGARPEDNPFRLKGMNEAVTRLRQAIRQGELVAIYGDFDADGVTATALLVETLSALGARVKPYIPHRVDEGYGLNTEALHQLASEGVKVVVTVDCGIRSIEEVNYGRKLGLDIIITDHHSVGEEVPPALAVINPKQPDCRYPFKDLAGVGVAFKLAQALLRANRQVPVAKGEVSVNEEDLLDLAALGTVADLAPLLGENRSLVKRGLERLNAAERLGLRAMIAQAGLKLGQIDAATIGFILGPRLNAAGRMDDAATSYELLTCRSPDQAANLAQELEELNRRRQRLTLEALERAQEQAPMADESQKLLFVAGEDFPSGIVGLVAGRLTEEFYRPSLVVELGPEESRGSARSIPEFNITAALDQCSGLLVKYGGHAAAAGFTVANDNLEALQERLKELAAEQLEGVELTPTLLIDAEVELSEMDWATQALLTQLEPCGYANPAPLLLSRRAIVRDARAVGTDGGHLKLSLSDGQARWGAIAFRQGQWAGQLPPHIDVVYSLEINEWRGEKQLQLNVKDLRPSA